MYICFSRILRIKRKQSTLPVLAILVTRYTHHPLHPFLYKRSQIRWFQSSQTQDCSDRRQVDIILDVVNRWSWKFSCFVPVEICRHPRGWIMTSGRPGVVQMEACLKDMGMTGLDDGQTEAYLKDTGMAGLASVLAMARRRTEYRHKVEAATRCFGVCPHTWPDLSGKSVASTTRFTRFVQWGKLRKNSLVLRPLSVVIFILLLETGCLQTYDKSQKMSESNDIMNISLNQATKSVPDR